VKTKNFKIILNLERIKPILEFLDNPQNKFKIIHVAGTNGKGSICHMISSILKTSGVKTALYTSPHLINQYERIKINNKPISEFDFLSISKKISKILNQNKMFLTEFELKTAIAFYYFAKNKVEIAVVETGLGGRFDATNICKNKIICVITSISFDHTEYLGNTLEEIALEKAGIIKKNRPLVLYPNQENSIIKIITQKCNELNCELIIPDKNLIIVKENLLNDNNTIFEYKNLKLELPLLGDHQTWNLLTALNVIEILKKTRKISDQDIQIGLKNISLHSRFEVLSRNPFFILDGAHNPGGSIILSECLKKFFYNKNLIAIFGVMKDKDIDGILKPIYKYFKKIFTTEVNNSRAMRSNKLSEIVRNFIPNTVSTKNVAEAIDFVFKEKNYDACIIFGSLYLAKEIFNHKKFKILP
jgi:dihydrofolate synthase/folylpolyglutamate synthase